MAESLVRLPTMLERWSTASGDAWRWLRHREPTADGRAAIQPLAVTLDEAAAVGRRLGQQVQAAPDGPPLANAASICRWELLVLRERLLDTEVESRDRGLRSRIVRHLDAAAAAARMLSLGYRHQSLDRICDGGQALDDHLEALSRLRSRLS